MDGEILSIETAKKIADLEQRIDKAIEYIESYNIDFNNLKFSEATITIRELKELLDILKGEDKE